jgi:hypothetical protein
MVVGGRSGHMAQIIVAILKLVGVGHMSPGSWLLMIKVFLCIALLNIIIKKIMCIILIQSLGVSPSFFKKIMVFYMNLTKTSKRARATHVLVIFNLLH